jgi:hypothetical protein
VPLTDFAVPTNVSGGRLWHYLDIAAIGTTTASPVKAVASSAVPAPSANIVFLGMSSGFDVTPASGDRQDTRVAARVDGLVMRDRDIILDSRGILARDGVPVVYVPQRFAFRAGGAGTDVTATNATAAEVPGAVKFALDVGAPNLVWYDPNSGSYTLSTGISAFNASGKAQWVPVFFYYRGSPSGFGGVRVIDYAASLAENQTTRGAVMSDMPRQSSAGGTGAFTAVPLSALDSASAAFFAALGVTSGVKRGTGEGVIVGDDVQASIRGARAFVRLYLHSSTGVFPATVTAYLRAADGTSANASPMTAEGQWTPNIRSYTVAIDSSLTKDVSYIWAGPTAGRSKSASPIIRARPPARSRPARRA